MKIRRIVTGFDQGGRSVFVGDDTLEAPWLPGVGEVCTAWSADEPASCRAVLELDDGAEVHIGPGDLIVQNGTRHRWRNPYDVPMKIATFMVGAHRV